jgi:S1-C subfamily serine protease
MNARAALAVVLGFAALAGCVNPPASTPPETVPVPATVSPEPAAQAVFRSVRAYTYRVRVQKCEGVGVATAFAVNKRTLVTNRHVVENTTRIDVETWDGRMLAVASAQQATGPDLAIIHLAQDAPSVSPGLAADDAPVDTHVYSVGYILGHAAHITKGVVVDYPDRGPLGLDQSGKVMEMSSGGDHGDSGSAIVDGDGHVVAVLEGIQVANGWIVSEPVSRLRPLLQGHGLTPATGC